MKAKICHTPPAVSVARQKHLSLAILNHRMSTYPAHTAHPRSNTRLHEITPSSGPSHGPAEACTGSARLHCNLRNNRHSCRASVVSLPSTARSHVTPTVLVWAEQTWSAPRHDIQRAGRHLSPAGGGALVESLHGVVRECGELGELGELRVELQYARTLCVGIHDHLQMEEQRTSRRKS